MSDRESYVILDRIYNAHKPVGATYLATELGIPQATIGRRLKFLENKGLIKGDGRRGRILTEIGLECYEKQSQLLATETDVSKLALLINNAPRKTLQEIVEIRRKLEGLAVTLACRNATESELKQLEELSGVYADSVTRGLPSSAKIDLGFHLLIAKISGNSTLYSLLRILLTMDDASVIFHAIAKQIESNLISIVQHHDLMKAICKRDEVEAVEKLNVHLDKVSKDINLRYDQS